MIIKEYGIGSARSDGRAYLISDAFQNSILKLLLDDSLVNQEKIGTSNYFCKLCVYEYTTLPSLNNVYLGSYPGASAAKIRAQHQSTKATLDDLTKKHEQAVEALAKVQVERGCGEDDEVSVQRYELSHELPDMSSLFRKHDKHY